MEVVHLTIMEEVHLTNHFRYDFILWTLLLSSLALGLSDFKHCFGLKAKLLVQEWIFKVSKNVTLISVFGKLWLLFLSRKWEKKITPALPCECRFFRCYANAVALNIDLVGECVVALARSVLWFWSGSVIHMCPMLHAVLIHRCPIKLPALQSCSRTFDQSFKFHLLYFTIVVR